MEALLERAADTAAGQLVDCGRLPTRLQGGRIHARRAEFIFDDRKAYALPRQIIGIFLQESGLPCA